MKARPWLAWLASAGIVGVLGFSLRRPAVQNFGNGYSYAGETFLHHRLIGRPMALPLLDVSAALLRTHDPEVDEPTIVAALLLGVGGLTVAAGLSASPLVFLAWLYRRIGVFSYVQVAFSFLIVLAAAVLMWRSRKPTWTRSLAAGLAVGAALLFRSPLAFFPPVLALYDWRLAPRRPLGPIWRTALLTYLLPYLFLAPWLAANWRLHHKLIPFENGEANCNVVTGALGLVQTVEGPWPELVEDRAIDAASGPGEVLAWAAREALHHPLRYAQAYVRRLLVAAGWAGPFLFLAGMAGFWLNRRRPPYQVLALFLAYFVAIHCCLSIERTYLMPAWPLAALLIGSLLDRLFPAIRLPASAKLYRPARGAAGAALAAVLGLCAYAELMVGVPVDAAPPDEAFLARELAARPREAWLLFERGRRRWERGDEGGALDMIRSLALQPGLDVSMTFSTALPLLGRGYRMFERPPFRYYEDLKQAYDASLAGRSARARAELSAAVRHYEAGNMLVRGESAREAHALRLLRSEAAAERRISWELSGALARLRPEQARRLMQSMGAALSESPEAWAAALAAQAGDLTAARGVLARAESRDADPASVARDVSGVLRRMAPRPALAAVRRAPRAMLSCPEYHIVAAEIAARARARAAALSSLGRAGALNPGFELRRRMAAIYRGFGETARAEALLAALAAQEPSDRGVKEELAGLYRDTGRPALARKVLDELARADPFDARVQSERRSAAAQAQDRAAELSLAGPAASVGDRIRRALLAAQLGERSAAERSIAEVRGRAVGFEERRALAQVYRALGDQSREQELLAALSRERPGDLGLRQEILLARARAAQNSGQDGAALALLGEAAGIAPGERRTLASLYRALGRRQTAAALLDAAMQAAPREAGLKLEAAALAADEGRAARALALLCAADTAVADVQDRLRVAALYGRLGRADDEARVLAELARAAPRSPQVMVARAERASRLGRREEAAGLLREGLRLSPDDETLHRAALCFQDLKEYRQAEAILQDLARRSPGDAQVRGDLGACRFLAGDAARAEGDLKAAVELDPRRLSAYLTLGAVYASEGLPDKATQAYTAGLAVKDPKDAGLRARLEESFRASGR